MRRSVKYPLYAEALFTFIVWLAGFSFERGFMMALVFVLFLVIGGTSFALGKVLDEFFG